MVLLLGPTGTTAKQSLGAYVHCRLASFTAYEYSYCFCCLLCIHIYHPLSQVLEAWPAAAVQHACLVCRDQCQCTS